MKNNDTCHRLIPYAFLLAASVLAAFSACRKDDATIDLRAVIADRPSGGGQKVYIDDQHYACWENGDQVAINGTSCTVAVVTDGNNREATMQVRYSESGYTGAYPADYVKTCTGGNVVLTMPSTQTVVMENGHQQIVAPMVGYTANDKPSAEEPLRFHNVAGVLKINVTNSLSQDLNIYALEIESSNAYIAGTGTVDGVDTPTPSLTISSDKTKNVMLLCNNQALESGSEAEFEIVVAPFTDPTQFTVHVLATGATDNLKYTFHRKSKSGITIARNQIGSISVKLADDGNIHTGEAGNYFWGQGNADCPFIIATKTDFIQLRNLVRDNITIGTSSLLYNSNGIYYRQVADIDISSETTWGQSSNFAVGDKNHPFVARYYGGGHSVKLGVTSTENNKYYDTPVGIFGIISGGAYLNGVVAKGSISTTESKSRIAGVVGKIFGAATLDSCINYATLSSSNASTTDDTSLCQGGICAYANPHDENTEVRFNYCENHGTITKAYGKGGGICGATYKGKFFFKGCINYGNLNATGSNLGGITGIDQGISIYSDCVNEGKLTTSSYGCGGILGQSRNNPLIATLTIRHSNNHGIIYGGTTGYKIGGIIGEVLSNIPIDIVRCTNIGAISGSYNIAGISGYSANSGRIDSCLNTGNITATGNKSNCGVAGIVAVLYTNSIDITNCKNTGNIESTTTGSAYMYVAGIIGGYDNVGGKRFNLANEGTIKAVNAFAIAGIDGRCNSTPTFANCYNTGKLKGKATHVAGILGYVGITSAMYFNNCYNAGDMSEVTGSTTKYSLIGYRNGTNNIIINCYHLNGVTNFQNNGTNVAGCSAITSIGTLVDNAVAIYTYNTKTITGTSINNNNLCDALNAWCTDNAAYGPFVSWSTDGSSNFPKLNLTF